MLSRALPPIGRASSKSTRSIWCAPLIMRVFWIVGRDASRTQRWRGRLSYRSFMRLDPIVRARRASPLVLVGRLGLVSRIELGLRLGLRAFFEAGRAAPAIVQPEVLLGRGADQLLELGVDK